MKKKLLFISSLFLSFFYSTQFFALELYNPLGGDVSIPKLIGRLLNIIIGVVGAISLLMFIYGGFLWLTSAGKSDRIEEGKKTLLWATLGLVVIFSARAILTLFFKTLLP